MIILQLNQLKCEIRAATTTAAVAGSGAAW